MTPGETDDKENEDPLHSTELDVYPVKVDYNQTQITKMKFIRFVCMIIFLYLIIPFDLYIHTHWRRIWLYSTDFYQETVTFEDITDPTLANFTLTL